MAQRGIRNPGSPSKVLDRGRVFLPDDVSAIWNPLYDYQTKTAAATSAQRFFQEPIGGSGGKTLEDTNMELNGQLPKGQRFIVTGIQVELYPGVSINSTAAANQYADDVRAFYESGALIFTIGSKRFVEQGNLMKFPPVNRLAVQSAVAIDAATAETFDSYNYAVAGGREFAVDNLALESSTNFNVEIIGGAAMPSGEDAKVGITLNGWLYRNAQ